MLSPVNEGFIVPHFTGQIPKVNCMILRRVGEMDLTQPVVIAQACFSTQNENNSGHFCFHEVFISLKHNWDSAFFLDAKHLEIWTL